MNRDARIEPLVERVLIDRASSRAPDRLLYDVAATTRHQGQRPGWLASIKEPPMRYRSNLAVGSPTMRLSFVLAVTSALLLVLAGAVIAGASLLPSPGPLALVSNGLIALTEVVPLSEGDPSLAVVQPDGSGYTTVADHAVCPAWSPDGRWLLYWKIDGELPTVEIADSTAGFAAIVLHPNPPAKMRIDRVGFWAPDGQSLWIHVWDDQRASSTLARVWLPGAIAPAELARWDDAGWAGLAVTRGPDVTERDISFSPDGRLIAIEAHEGALSVLGVDGSGAREIATTGAYGLWSDVAAWSPDSTWIAYGDPRGGISTVRVSTGVVRQVETRSGYWPRWSPVGHRLAYLIQESGTSSYVVMDLDHPSSIPHVLPVDPGTVVAGPPVWSPDGTMLLGGLDCDYTGGTEEASIVRLDLTGRVAPLVIEGVAPSWQRLDR